MFWIAANQIKFYLAPSKSQEMREIVRFLRLIVPPYKKYFEINILFNILSAILNLFSFALIIPILNILFKLTDKVYHYMDWSFMPFSLEAWKATPTLIKNNFFWYVSDLINTHGGSFTLIILGFPHRRDILSMGSSIWPSSQVIHPHWCLSEIFASDKKKKPNCLSFLLRDVRRSYCRVWRGQ